MNQITSVTDSGNVRFSYDLSGNLLNDGIRATSRTPSTG